MEVGEPDRAIVHTWNSTVCGHRCRVNG
jgi:hypothetical protein